MVQINRLAGARRQAEPGALPTKASYPDIRLQAGFARVKTAPHRSRLIMPILLLIALAVAVVGLNPGTAELCGKLEDFPCGP